MRDPGDPEWPRAGARTEDDAIAREWAWAYVRHLREQPWLHRHGVPVRGKASDAGQAIPEDGGVYILHAEGTDRYKIGMSDNLRQRIVTLRNSSPLPLNVVRLWIARDPDSPTERELHDRFAGSRLHGEWFASSPELLDLIAETGVQR